MNARGEFHLGYSAVDAKRLLFLLLGLEAAMGSAYILTHVVAYG